MTAQCKVRLKGGGIPKMKGLGQGSSQVQPRILGMSQNWSLQEKWSDITPNIQLGLLSSSEYIILVMVHDHGK